MTIKTLHVKICGTYLKQDLRKINGFSYIYQKTTKTKKWVKYLIQELGKKRLQRKPKEKNNTRKKG